MAFFGIKPAAKTQQERSVKEILEEQQFEEIKSTTIGEKVRQVATQCSLIRKAATGKFEIMSPEERNTVLQFSKIDISRIELETGEKLHDYLNTAAIALNLLLEFGFKPREDIVHYWQFIENGFMDSQLKVQFIKEYF